jgi:hypothetical protein
MVLYSYILFFQLLDRRWEENDVWPEKQNQDDFQVKHENIL